MFARNSSKIFFAWRTCTTNILICKYVDEQILKKTSLWTYITKKLICQGLTTNLFLKIRVQLLITNCWIPDVEVSMAILNTTDISLRWCKLNFGPSWDHVKSCHFLERIDVRRQYFYFFIQIPWNNWQEMTWTMLLDNDLGLLWPFICCFMELD